MTYSFFYDESPKLTPALWALIEREVPKAAAAGRLRGLRIGDESRDSPAQWSHPLPLEYVGSEWMFGSRVGVDGDSLASINYRAAEGWIWWVWTGGAPLKNLATTLAEARAAAEEALRRHEQVCP